MDFDLNWDEIKKKIKETIELEKNESDNTIKIKIKGDIQENPMVNQIVSTKEGIENSLNQFVGKGEKIDCEIEYLEDENSILMKFNDKKTTKESYKFFNEMFFGDFVKDLLEKMMDAFKDMGNLEDLMK